MFLAGRVTGAGFLLVLLSSNLLSPAPARAQSVDPKIQTLAQGLAESIRGRLSGKNRPITYLVFDVWNAEGARTVLGLHLADEVSSALANQPGMQAVDRAKLREVCAQDAINPDIFNDDRVGYWTAWDLGAVVAVQGRIEPHEDSFVLHLRVIGTDRNNGNQAVQFADAGDRLEWTEERRTLNHSEVSWQSPAIPWAGVPRLPAAGFSMPECVHCPNPPYTEAARKARVEGTVRVQILIAEDGSVKEMFPLQGLPSGLTESTVQTVKGWRFKPILNAEGKPVEAQTTIEATFRLC
jgi:TonB family protein